MTERLPSHNSNYQNAVFFVSDKLKSGEKLTLALIDEASTKYNLTPREGEMLTDYFKKKKEGGVKDTT